MTPPNILCYNIFLEAPAPKEVHMTMLKVIEVLAESDKSWEDAAQSAVKTAQESVRNVRSI